MMKIFKLVTSELFKGMGVLCGRNSAYVSNVIGRDDRNVFRRDLEVIGLDMWKAVDRVNEGLESSSNEKNGTVS